MSIVMSTTNGVQRTEPPVALGRTRNATHEAMIADLTAALLREEKLLAEKNDLLQRQELLTQEFEHRLVNGLQLIVSLLTLQSRAAPTAEAAAQLGIAATRVAAIGRVHRRLHILDHEQYVELKGYLQGLCDDLTSMLLQGQQSLAVEVRGAEIRLPTALGIPLGFIVNELITNSVKYAKGRITVEIESSTDAHSLSVADDGPGLPAEFDPTKSRGLGMRIVQSLAKQIDGALYFAAGDGGNGARFTVTFAPPPQPA